MEVVEDLFFSIVTYMSEMVYRKEKKEIRDLEDSRSKCKLAFDWKYLNKKIMRFNKKK